MIVLLVPASFIRGRRSFEGGVYSNNYGTPTLPRTTQVYKWVPATSGEGGGGRDVMG